MDRRAFLGRIAKALGVAVAAPLVAKVAQLFPVHEDYDDVTDDQLSQFITDTLRDLGKPRFTEIAASLQRHETVRRLLKANRISFNVNVEDHNVRSFGPEQGSA